MLLNSKAFTPEEVEKGFHLDLFNYLLDFNKKSSDSFYEIHITNDGYCTIVEWFEKSHNDNYSNDHFEYIDDEHVVMLERLFPDHTYRLFYGEEDYQEELKEFLKENPNYKKNEYGLWYDEEENNKLKEELNGEKNNGKKI